MASGISRFERAFCEEGYWKAAVALATAAALPAYTQAGTGRGATLTGTAAGVLTVDGVNVLPNQRVLVKDEGGADAPYNGIYVVTDTGARSNYVLTRAEDMDEADDVMEGAGVPVTGGDTNARRVFHLRTANPAAIVFETTDLLFWLTGEVQRMELLITTADLTVTTVSTPQTFNFPTLPDGAVPIGGGVFVSTPIAGPGISVCTGALGVAGAVSQFMAPGNLLTATASWKDTPGGYWVTRTRREDGGIVPILTITPAGVGALSACTMCSLAAYFYYSVAQQ